MSRKRNGIPLNGWLVLDKPPNVSSSQAVGRARWLARAQKAGHGGTLDPLATGLLPIAFGEATKTSNYVVDGCKSYIFHVFFGQSRTTDDAEGEIVQTSDVRPSENDVKAVLGHFIGQIDQVPPTFSAIKVNGERAYKLARAGVPPVMPTRSVRVNDVRLTQVLSEDEMAFTVDCGKGTYVRSLARDIACALGTFGFVSLLRRTRAGPFTLDHAISLEKLEEVCHGDSVKQYLRPIEDVLDDIPAIPLTKSQANKLRSGQALSIKPSDLPCVSVEHSTVLATEAGCAVALSIVVDGVLKPVRVFNS